MEEGTAELVAAHAYFAEVIRTAACDRLTAVVGDGRTGRVAAGRLHAFLLQEMPGRRPEAVIREVEGRLDQRTLLARGRSPWPDGAASPDSES